MTVARVERHIIGTKHALFPLIDEYAFKSKNLYNYANYMIRQVFIITSKLAQGKEITKEQQEYLKYINKEVDEYNTKKNILAEQKNKEYKELSYFDKEHKSIGYDFLQFVCAKGSDYKAIMAQVAQQTLKVLDKNWKSFFKSIKDWSKNKIKYTGMPSLPQYKPKTTGRFNIYFTNQNCKIIDEYIKFPECFKGLYVINIMYFKIYCGIKLYNFLL